MDRQRRKDLTGLNRHDREILAKYTGFYSNYIESNTAKTEITDMAKEGRHTVQTEQRS